jgi:hypothetical protein
MENTDTEICRFCEYTGTEPYDKCYTHCSESEDGKHVANPRTIDIRMDRGAMRWDSTSKTVVADVNCENCGQSGSFFIEIIPDAVNWD